MKPEVEAQLRSDHEAAKTHRELATVEAAIWLELRRDSRETGIDIGHPRDALGKFLSAVSMRAIEDRRSLFITGDLADPLWSLVEQDLSLATAVHLMRKAKAVRIPPETMSAALRRTIAEYYARPYQRDLGNGKVARFTTPQRGVGAPGRPSRPRGASNGSGSSDRQRSFGMDVPSDFWKTLRDMSAEYAARRLPGSSPGDIEEDVRALEIDVKVAFEQFTARIRRSQTPMRVVLSRRQITEACRVLLVDPPRSLTDVPAAFRSKAQLQFKRLAREYHPDTHGGSQATRPQYEAVVAAWNILREFFSSGLPKGAES